MSFSHDAELVSYIQKTVKGLLRNWSEREQRQKETEAISSLQNDTYTEDTYDLVEIEHPYIVDRVQKGYTYSQIARRHGVSKTQAYRVTKKELLKLKEEVLHEV